MSVSDPLADPPPSSTSASVLLFSTTPPTQDPPPPYPLRERRARPPRPGRRRRTLEQPQEHTHSQVSSTATGGDSEYDTGAPPPHDELFDGEEHNATETTPLLNPPVASPPRGGLGTRQRTLSLTSTLRSSVSLAPSLAHTFLSAFHPERDSDLDPGCETADVEGDSDDGDLLDSPSPRGRADIDDQQRAFIAELSSQRLARQRTLSWADRWRRYFRPMGKRAYYAPLFHLFVLNFPYAVLAWVYLFVFTVTGTTTLMALPLGAVLSFLDLIGARVLSRGEIALQTTFHGPLAYPSPYPPLPIFTRLRQPTPAEVEAGLGMRSEHSFYRNAYAMFTDPTSYQALFYFLVIKPGVTLLLSLLLVVLVPVSAVLVLPFPATLRLARRLGIWQANVAIEGLCFAVR
ncbi:hypothetical protein B0H21DRAFT_171284 [Amylocystis lapponica]|nr:hypothetical protein B0H21DRAFT_171284 [Amylocystis lapponica]